MALSNTAVPRYYGAFRDAVIRGEIPVNKEISMEMNRIDDLISNPGIYYDDEAVEGWIRYCENELTLTPKGRYLVVVMMRQFFIGVNNLRDQARAALPGEEKELLFGEGIACK